MLTMPSKMDSEVPCRPVFDVDQISNVIDMIKSGAGRLFIIECLIRNDTMDRLDAESLWELACKELKNGR